MNNKAAPVMRQPRFGGVRLIRPRGAGRRAGGHSQARRPSGFRNQGHRLRAIPPTGILTGDLDILQCGGCPKLASRQNLIEFGLSLPPGIPSGEVGCQSVGFLGLGCIPGSTGAGEGRLAVSGGRFQTSDQSVGIPEVGATAAR